jgi:hypothetical protein
MSPALVYSCARAGVDAPLVRVEVHLSGGPAITRASVVQRCRPKYVAAVNS